MRAPSLTARGARTHLTPHRLVWGVVVVVCALSSVNLPTLLKPRPRTRGQLGEEEEFLFPSSSRCVIQPGSGVPLTRGAPLPPEEQQPPSRLQV